MNLMDTLQRLDQLKKEASLQRFSALFRIIVFGAFGYGTFALGITTGLGILFAAVTGIEAVRMVSQWKRYTKAEKAWIQYAREAQPMIDAYLKHADQVQKNQRAYHEQMVENTKKQMHQMVDEYKKSKQTEQTGSTPTKAKFSYQFDSEKEQVGKVYRKEVPRKGVYTKKR